jgi:hypothetical protein
MNNNAIINNNYGRFQDLILLDSWAERFVISLWNNQQIRHSSSTVYWHIQNSTPTCFSNSLPSSGGRSYLRSYWSNMCICITICPVWPVVKGCDQQCIHSPVKNLGRQRCTEGFNSGVKGLWAVGSWLQSHATLSKLWAVGSWLQSHATLSKLWAVGSWLQSHATLGKLWAVGSWLQSHATLSKQDHAAVTQHLTS